MAETNHANKTDRETPTHKERISPLKVTAAVGLLALVSGVLLERITIGLAVAGAGDGRGHLAAYLGATMLGLPVGPTELAARYRDAPLIAVQSLAGMIYMATNAGVSLVIFWLLRTGQISGATCALPCLDAEHYR